MLNNLSIKNKFILILTLPLLIALYLLFDLIWRQWQVSQSLRDTLANSQTIIVTNQLLQELQLERGLSILLTLQDNEPDEKRVFTQRQRTDEKLAVFNHTLSVLKASTCKDSTGYLFEIKEDNFCRPLHEQLDSVTEEITALATLRYQGDRITLPAQPLFEGYTRINDALLGLTSVLVERSQGSPVANRMTAYYFLQQVRENAGQERALLAVAIEQEKLSPDSRRQLIALIAQQQAYTQLFGIYALKNNRELLNQLQTGPLSHAVNRLQDGVLSQDNSLNVTMYEWFEVASRRVEQLYQLNEKLGSELQTAAHESHRDAVRLLLSLSLLSALLIAMTVIFSSRIIRMVTRQLASFMAVIDQVERNTDMDARVEVYTRDELGGIAQRFNAMLDLLKNHQADLRKYNNKLDMAHAVINASMDSIMISDANNIITMVNPSFTRVTGYTEEEAIGQPINLLSSGRHDPAFYQQMWTELETSGYWQGEVWNRRKNGEIFPEWLSITPIVIGDKEPTTFYAGIFNDISRLKRDEAMIQQLAYYDPLTKLPNRQLLKDRLEVALATAKRDQKRIALVFIELDRFKAINDTLGHSVGDQVLCEVTRRLLASVRDGDTVARIGGDEFALLLTTLQDDHTVEDIARRIEDVLQQSLLLDDHDIHVSACMGASSYPGDAQDAAKLLKYADVALTQAKHDRAQSIRLYSPAMNKKAMARMQMGQLLRKALANDEFVLLYQPKIDLASERVVGVEALLRWHNEELGLVSPVDFIPLTEEMGLIGDIGAWVLEQACCQCQRWIDAGFAPIHVSVNVSAQQFKHRDLIKDVEQALLKASLKPRYLDLEITESCVVDDVLSLISQLDVLRSLYISTSMDDFGTGYSSLSHLTRLPLDHLKIDGSFMAGIPDSKADAEMVSTIILMAHNLGLKVIAERVETEAQVQFLRALRCDQIQGYYFSRPLPADDVQKMLVKVTGETSTCS